MLPEKPITRREMYLDYIARNGAIGGGITIDEEPTQGSYHATGSGGLYEALESLREDINALRVEVDGKVYGVAGVGQEASALTRTHDAVGMVAQVGTDGDNSNVRNDFDNAGPWMRRKCVGRWVDGGDRARFVVSAYLGDPWYTEDGSIGDYVAVECPRCYYRFNHETGALDITAQQREGYRAFDIFCRNHSQAETMEVFYAPAYFLGVKDGHAVSLPGLDDEQGAYEKLVDTAKTYDGSASDFAMIMPVAWNFYQWALFTVEFATQNCQNVMKGCCSLRSADNESCTFIDSTHILTSNYQVARISGEYIAITKATSHIDANYKATHRIVSVVRCDENGNASASGTHQLIEVEDLGKGYYTYNTSSTYYLAGRPYRTGYCNTVSTPSGSPVSNSNGYYPCKYRWVENPWGSHYQTAHDIFCVMEGNENNNFLEWYYCLKPWEYVPSATSQPDATALQGDEFIKLGVSTSHADYNNGYIKTRQYDNMYPDIWIPEKITGASSDTYFGDYAFLSSLNPIRSCRYCGYWANNLMVGMSFVNIHHLPSFASAAWSACLFFSQ